jgi:hypothetical protein
LMFRTVALGSSDHTMAGITDVASTTLAAFTPRTPN